MAGLTLQSPHKKTISAVNMLWIWSFCFCSVDDWPQQGAVDLPIFDAGAGNSQLGGPGQIRQGHGMAADGAASAS